MVLATGMLFALGVGLFLYDFFFLAPRRRGSPAAWPAAATESQG